MAPNIRDNFLDVEEDEYYPDVEIIDSEDQDLMDNPRSADDEAPEEASLQDAVEKGSKCDVKNLFHVPTAKDPKKFHWVDQKPAGTSAAEKSKTKKEREAYAVVDYQKYDEIEDEWVTSYLQINSEKIQTALKSVMEGYPGLTEHDMKSFKPPFYPFIHRWDAFLKSVDAATDQESHDHLALLRDILAPRIQEKLARAAEARSTGHVAYNDLPLVFVPEETAVGSVQGFRAAGTIRQNDFRYDSCRREGYFGVNVDVVDWDGRRCGLRCQEWSIYEYSGLRAFSALDAAPFDLHPDKESIKTSLIERGRAFEKLRGQHFKAFTEEHDERVNERTIIDARAFHKYAPREYFPEFANLNEIGHLTWTQSMNRFSSIFSDETSTKMKVDLAPMTDHECMLAVPTVKCFTIETKKWSRLDLTKFHEISWSEHAFDRLVLDQDEKDLLLALVDRDEHKKNNSFDDFISGKGQGLVTLLSGPPGVGKTLTAESIAEHLRRPLYRVGAGDLGISAASVENCLDNALKLCAHWNAVLLIDEADVFMEARNPDHLQRNELVSVFLRLLEYYQGIMILTTNRLRSLDPAFESRIDITLTYPPLTEADRKQVWKNFFMNFDNKAVAIDDRGLDELAKWDFNGRQIKSAIKTARILAARKQQPLNVHHLSVVLNLRAKALDMMGDEVELGVKLGNGVKRNGVVRNGK